MSASPRTFRERCGFTLIEMLVVIAIIAVLMCILLPAVQRTREAANRLACANNLKQLGLALLNFHDTYGKFPPGQATGPLPEAGITQSGVNHGWAPFILPFIEQQNLADRYRWDLWSADPRNQPVMTTQLSVFQCPSVPEQNRFMTFGVFTNNGKAACGDYAPAWSVDPILARIGLIDGGADYQGVLVPNKMTPICNITDGTSNTVLLTEDAGRPRLWRAGRPFADQTVVGGPWAAYNSGIILRGASADGSTSPGQCAINCTNASEVYSFHPGGADAVFADGSLHFLRASMNIRTVAALITRAGGEVSRVLDY